MDAVITENNEALKKLAKWWDF